ncbi:MAG: hypothetical protein CUN55_09705 [Phototrophicales bacterium]|nr:MAG: hypothetical protein CUN55_09705 [Phototrophicales bacterium]
MAQRIHFDPYTVLGISRQAKEEEIKRVFRQTARRFHPDHNKNPGAHLHFLDVNAAYDAITSGEALMLLQDTSALPKFNTQIHVSRLHVPIIPEPQVIYVLLEIMPTFPESYSLRRNPMNLALALDCSSSMKGARLNRVKVAARQILEQLTPNDYIALISYADKATVEYPSQPAKDVSELRSIINLLRAGGSTEIYQGLLASYEQVKRNFSRNAVNHIILITDGRTYGDEELALALAKEAAETGIGISAMGIGDEWNDEFLDALASHTGGASSYINSPMAVSQFLEDRIMSLGQSFAERLRLVIAPDSDVKIESVWRLSPHAQPLDFNEQPIPLGTLESRRPMRVLVQLLLPENMKEDFRPIVRLDVTGDVLLHGERERLVYKVVKEQSIDVQKAPPHDEPPRPIIDALGKLALYRMQEKVEQSVTQGQIVEATRQLQNLATRLLEMGQEELSAMARQEATRILKTRTLSEEGRKALKYGTRQLLSPPQLLPPRTE